MKGLSAITFAVVVAVSASANAATTKAKSQPKKSQAISSGATSSSNISVPQSAPAAAAASSTAVLSAPAKARKITGELYNEAYYKASAMKNQDGTIENWTYARMFYQIDDKNKVYIRQGFTTGLKRNVTDANGKVTKNAFQGSTLIDDVELGLTRSKIAAWTGGGDLTAQARVYVPISADSNRINNHGTFHVRAMAAQPINKSLKLTYSPRVYYFNQTQAGQLSVDGSEMEQNAEALISNYALVDYQIAEPVAANLTVGPDNLFAHGVRAANLAPKHMSKLFLDMSVSADVVKNVSVGLGVENKAPFGDRKGRSFALLRDNDTKYYMNLTAGL